MAPECSIKDLADTIQSRLTQEAGLMSSSMIQSISTTLADATRHLYEVSNSRQSLFKLPNEILTRIVGNVTSCPTDEISDADKQPIWRSATRDTIALLPVTHTCRRLRQVVVADTMRWRHITTDNSHFIELSLSRSGPTNPLTMWLSPRVPSSPSRMPLSEFHHQLAPRLRELHFHDCVPKNLPGLKRFLELPFPHLESFSWTGELSLRDWAECQWDDNSLPSSGITATNILYLHIQQMTMLLPASDLPRLTHLCISSLTAPGIPILIVDVLRHCPALTSLILRKLLTSVVVGNETMPKMQSLHLPSLSRVILADMNYMAIYYFAHFFAGQHTPCMQIVLTDQADTLYAYPRELFASLYRQYWRPDQATDTSRLSVAAEASEDHADTGLSVTLANSTRLLRITVSPKALERDAHRSGGRSKWRESVLGPLRTLPDLRASEVWLTDMHMDTFMPTDSLPFWGVPAPDDADPLFPAGSQAPAAAPGPPSPENVVIVHNCSARGCRHSLSIRPSIAALPKSPSRADSQSEGPSAAVPPPLAHLRLAVGYDAVDLPRLRETWHSALLPGGKGQIELSGKLLRELASGEYAYVRHAELVVQLMPHLALDAGELAHLREYFPAVDVEEIDRLPTVPVPDCVRDDALAPGGFTPGSVLY